jgi:hypothetical protein
MKTPYATRGSHQEGNNLQDIESKELFQLVVSACEEAFSKSEALALLKHLEENFGGHQGSGHLLPAADVECVRCNDESVLSASALARIMGKRGTTVADWCKAGQLKAIRCSHSAQWHIAWPDIQDFMSKRAPPTRK